MTFTPSLLTLLGALALCTAHPAQATPSPPPPFERVLILLLENSDYQQTATLPAFARLAERGALLTNYHAVAHPSQANYIGLVAGDTLGVDNNHKHSLDRRHLGDLMDDAGLSWRLYAEGYPGDCYLHGRAGHYVRKHVPFLSFRNITTVPERCNDHVVPAERLQQDIERGELPQLLFYIPDQRNNGHDTDLQHAGRWLQQQLQHWLAQPALSQGLLLVITFDEDDGKGDNRVWTLLLGDRVQAGLENNQRYNHYSLLRTLQQSWGLGSLGREDARAQAISGIWRAPAAPTRAGSPEGAIRAAP